MTEASRECVAQGLAPGLDESGARLDDKLAVELPENWSQARKWVIVAALSAMGLVVNLSLVMCAPASPAILVHFGTQSRFLSNFFITVWDLGEAVGPLLLGPLSETFGRARVYHAANVSFIACTVAAGFSRSMAMLIVFRALTGLSTAAICLNPAVVGDMFAMRARGGAMALMSLPPLLGPVLGPIIGGFAAEQLGWRWTFWLNAAIAAVAGLFMLLVYRETYKPKVLARRGAQHPAQPRKFVARIPELIARPFVLLFSESRAAILAGYLAIVYAILFLLASTMGTVFQDAYCFSAGASGLVYIGIASGMLFGTLLCKYTLDRLLVWGARRGSGNEPDSVQPASRLLAAVPGSLLLPAGLLIYGWTLEKRTAWIAPVIGSGLAGFSLATATIPTMNFLVDVFTDRAASAIAAVLSLRYIIGTFLPIAGPYLYASIGYGWGNSILALIALLCAPVLPLLLWMSRWPLGSAQDKFAFNKEPHQKNVDGQSAEMERQSREHVAAES